MGEARCYTICSPGIYIESTIGFEGVYVGYFWLTLGMSLGFFVVGSRFAVFEYLGFEKLVVCGSCSFARSGSLRMELQGILETL